MKTYAMSGRTGRGVANQTVVNDGLREIFFSYGCAVASRDLKTGLYAVSSQYIGFSRTTSKYLYKFLNIQDGAAGLKRLFDTGAAVEVHSIS